MDSRPAPLSTEPRLTWRDPSTERRESRPLNLRYTRLRDTPSRTRFCEPTYPVIRTTTHYDGYGAVVHFHPKRGWADGCTSAQREVTPNL